MASSLETNKILAAILTAGIVASGSAVISSIIYNPTPPAETAYQVAVAVDGDAEAQAPQQAAPLPVLLAEASPEDGEGIARACTACHSFEQGGPTKIGPPLWDVVGTDIASAEGFAYSDALAGKEGEWTFENLGAFLENPQDWAPGTRMTYAGIQDAQDRADLLAYLRSLSEDPVALPEVTEEMQVAAAEEQPAEGEAGAEQQAEAAGGDGLATLLAEASAEEGESATRVCAACHSFEQGGPHKIGPALWNVVGSEIASAEGYSYSDALAGKEGEWTYQNLDAYLANPQEWAPGTKMTFAGINDADQRADVIKYLRSLAEEPEPLPEGETDAAGQPTEGEAEPQQAEATAAEDGGEQQAQTGQETAATEPTDGTEAAAGGGGLGTLLAEASAEAGEGATRVCAACHSFEQGGPNKIGPALWGVVGSDIASVEGYSYSDALSQKEGEWTYEKLDAYLANPREWAPGTKMAFAGISQEGQRADVIKYLRSLAEEPEPLPEGG